MLQQTGKIGLHVSTSQSVPQVMEAAKSTAESVKCEQVSQPPSTPTTVLQQNNAFQPVIVNPTQLLPVLPVVQKRLETREKNGVLGKLNVSCHIFIDQ